MSFSFSVAATKPISAAALFDALDIEGIKSIEEFSRTSPLTEGVFHLYVDGRSTRGVECALENGSFSVRLLTMASAEDFELGIQLIEAAATILEEPIEAEDSDEPLPLLGFRAQYGSEWVQGMLSSAPSAIVNIAERENRGPITIPGLLRPYHLGTRKLKLLRSAGPESEFANRLYEDLRRIQYVNLEEYYEAKTLVSKGADGKEITFAAWTPEVRYWFPKVDYFVIQTPEGGNPFVPASVLLGLSSGKIRWLDEAQALVETFTEEEWGSFLASTRALRCYPPGKPKNELPMKTKQWWQFWK